MCLKDLEPMKWPSRPAPPWRPGFRFGRCRPGIRPEPTWPEPPGMSDPNLLWGPIPSVNPSSVGFFVLCATAVICLPTRTRTKGRILTGERQWPTNHLASCPKLRFLAGPLPGFSPQAERRRHPRLWPKGPRPEPGGRAATRASQPRAPAGPPFVGTWLQYRNPGGAGPNDKPRTSVRLPCGEPQGY